MNLIHLIVMTLTAFWLSPISHAEGLYAQLILPFDSERAYTYTYDKAEHALILAFPKTAANELGPLDHYDERLIKRVLIKDLGPIGTEVHLVLRDKNVRALVTDFSEPFRVAVDLFDADYSEERDPVSGLPVAAAGSQAVSFDQDSGHQKLLVSEDQASLETPLAFEAGEASKSRAEADKRRLLQPLPALLGSPAELENALRDTPAGIGRSWRDFPPYVYRIQTAAYEAGDRGHGPNRQRTSEALSSSEAMADYAGNLFNFGHENRALVAYQQVLHKNPGLFDKDALHLWKFAEVHLGQGNRALARGYYEALTEKHPESPLAQFARLRLLDVAAIGLISQGRSNDTAHLLERLKTIKPRTNGELKAQIAIRKAYWHQGAFAKDYTPSEIPKLPEDARVDLSTAYPVIESSRTAFLAASILLNDMLKTTTPWQKATGQFAEAYFKRFSGNETEPFRTQLREQLFTKLNTTLQAKVADGKLLDAIGDYEALPASLKAIRKTSKTAWALGEAYRKLGQKDQSIDFYAVAAAEASPGPDRFKAQFWLAVTAGDKEAELLAAGDQTKAGRLAKTKRKADEAMAASWAALKVEERNALIVAYKDHFEAAAVSSARLKTPPRLVLGFWTQALGTRVSTTASGDQPSWTQNFSPSGSAVVLLTNLGRRFGELGMLKEKREALGLLKHLKPADFQDDKAAKDLWAKQLVELAEDYRTANQYLDAGRLLNLVGTESENWAGRAEALYKSGLLLFRSGRRQEAIEAFKKSADDGNNLFYANLARERLSQLD